LTTKEGFIDVRQGREVRGSALGDTKLCGASFHAIDTLFDECAKVFTGATENCMPESIRARGIDAEVISGFVLDAFGNNHEAMCVGLKNFEDAVNECVSVERGFRK
jgi:hypothetical protein